MIDEEKKVNKEIEQAEKALQQAKAITEITKGRYTQEDCLRRYRQEVFSRQHIV